MTNVRRGEGICSVNVECVVRGEISGRGCVLCNAIPECWLQMRVVEYGIWGMESSVLRALRRVSCGTEGTESNCAMSTVESTSVA